MDRYRNMYRTTFFSGYNERDEVDHPFNEMGWGFKWKTTFVIIHRVYWVIPLFYEIQRERERENSPRFISGSL